VLSLYLQFQSFFGFFQNQKGHIKNHIAVSNRGLLSLSYHQAKTLNVPQLQPLALTKLFFQFSAGLFGEPKSIPFPLNQIGASFLGLPQVRKSLCRQAFAFPDKCVGEMEEQIASIHLGCKGWRNSLASFAKSGGFAGTQKYIQNIPIKTLCGENDRILGKKELKKIRNIEKLNFVGLQNCGHLPHIDLPSLSSKIIQDYFLE